VWLAMMEGGQGCLVGLQPIDKSLYADSHPRAFQTTQLAHKGDNMERFMIGRQFLVVLVIFAMNMMSATVEHASVLNLPDSVIGIFLDSGIAVILTTVIVGQLTSQVNAATCMLDFINNYFMTFTVYVSLAIEMSGLLHSVYLISVLFSKISGRPMQSNEKSRNNLQKVFFWVRVFFSLGVLVTAFIFTLSALFTGNTMVWGGIPDAISVAIFFILMCFAGILDGLQIALFAVVNFPESELVDHPLAHQSCQLVFRGHNLGAFLIGRQICVTVCMFVVARITAIHVDLDDADASTLFGVSDSVQRFLNTGLLGAVITTIVASLAWRVIASSFPIAFLSNPFVYMIIRLCLLLEKSGICSASWTLARIQKKLLGFRPDEEYLDGPELGIRSKGSTCSGNP
jgi:Silicon transporter